MHYGGGKEPMCLFRLYSKNKMPPERVNPIMRRFVIGPDGRNASWGAGFLLANMFNST